MNIFGKLLGIAALVLGLSSPALADGGAWGSSPPPVYTNTQLPLPNGVSITNFTTTASSAVVSTPSYCFGTADVGKYITITGAISTSASNQTGSLNTTISSTSSCSATLAASATVGLTGTGAGVFGTDYSGVMQTLVNNAPAGTRFMASQGIYVMAGYVQWKSQIALSGQGAGKTIFKWISPSDLTNGMFYGVTAFTTPYVDVQFTDFEIDEESATLATYSVNSKAFLFQSMNRPLWDHLYVHGCGATCMGADYLQGARVVNSVYANCGRYAVTGALGGSCVGIGAANSSFIDDTVVSGNTFYMPTVSDGNYCVFFESEQGASIYTRNIISNNVCRLQGQNQRGYGSSGTYGTIISNNQVQCNPTFSGQRGISVDLGTVVTTTADIMGKSIGNLITGCDLSIFFMYTSSTQTQPVTYTVQDNTVLASTRYGIWIRTGTVAVNNMMITGNLISGSGRSAIYMDGTVGATHLMVSNNKLFGNGTAALAGDQAGFNTISPINGLVMTGNDIYDGATGTQLYGIQTNGAAITNAVFQANNLAGNATSAINLTGGGTISGSIINNPGYNPQGAISVTPTASPWTYTAGNTPEVLYLYGGTVSNITKNSIQIGSASPAAIALDPGESVVVTYSSVPTASTDRK